MNKLKTIVNSSTTSIIDVRTPMEFNMGHINGAINIPLDQVQNHIDEFKNMPAPIVFYCRSGSRSGMAVSVLQQYGITGLYNGGGIDDMQFLMNQTTHV